MAIMRYGKESRGKVLTGKVWRCCGMEKKVLEID